MRRVEWVLLAGAALSVGCPAPSKTGTKTEAAAKTDAPAKTSAATKSGEGAKAEEPAPSPSQAAAQPSQTPAEEAAVEIVREFRGRLNVPPAALGGGGAPTRVIRSAAELKNFVDSIPKKKIQRQNPAPPSDDPLLQLPDLDWERHMLLVVRRRDTMYVHPKITGLTRAGADLRVIYELPPLGDTAMAAAVLDVGTYHAVLVPSAGGEVRFELQGAGEQSPPPSEPTGPLEGPR